MAMVKAADPADVAMAAAIIADESNSPCLELRKQYCERHRQQLRLGSFDDGYVVVLVSLLPHCRRVRELRVAGRGQWYGVPSWDTHTSEGRSDRFRLQMSGFVYRCETVPASMLSSWRSSNTRHKLPNGYSAEQVEAWVKNEPEQTALGGAQAAKGGSRRPDKPCTNWWCKRMVSYTNFAAHVRECTNANAEGRVLSESNRKSATHKTAMEALRGTRGY